MKRLLAISLLALAGCCGTDTEAFERLELIGSGEESVSLYDKGTDTVLQVNTRTMRIINTIPHWNYGGWRRE